ncbi:MAG TPA: hypothetical protein VHC20_04680 [Candidatus Paceibacterota bacterium]|nr:hypothetical protein [Candidatus Paceibacterota bacterium]
MPLTPTQVSHLENFLGYGRLDAPVWFVGMEEGGGGPDNIRARLKFGQVEDCAEAHRTLRIPQYHRAERPVIQRTWGQMVRFMLVLQRRECSADEVRAYQASQLGRSHGQTMLLELMPVPKRSLNERECVDLLPCYAVDGYRDEVRKKRIRLLRSVIARHEPLLVLCYGKAYWEHFSSLFPGAKFRTGGSGMLRPYQWARRGEQVLVLTHHLVAPSMNGWIAPLAAHVRTLLPMGFAADLAARPE